MESKPMTAAELGRYVCVIHPIAGCLHTPDVTIRSDGVWVKAGEMFSSAHRDCYEARQAEDQMVTIKRDGSEVAKVADADAAFRWLIDHQGQSVNYALRYGGYSVHAPDGTELLTDYKRH